MKFEVKFSSQLDLENFATGHTLIQEIEDILVPKFIDVTVAKEEC